VDSDYRVIEANMQGIGLWEKWLQFHCEISISSLRKTKTRRGRLRWESERQGERRGEIEDAHGLIRGYPNQRRGNLIRRRGLKEIRRRCTVVGGQRLRAGSTNIRDDHSTETPILAKKMEKAKV